MRIEPAGISAPVNGNLQRELQSRGDIVTDPTRAVTVPAQLEHKTAEQLDRMVEKMNETARVFGHHLQFEAVRPNRIVIRVVDSASGQVITEIPPEKLIKAFEGMEHTLGMLLDEKS